jgi:hypothetical protein
VFVDAAVAGCDHQYRAIAARRAKHQRLGDLTDGHAERIGRLLGRTRGDRKLDDARVEPERDERPLDALCRSGQRTGCGWHQTVNPPVTSITAPLM